MGKFCMHLILLLACRVKFLLITLALPNKVLCSNYVYSVYGHFKLFATFSKCHWLLFLEYWEKLNNFVISKGAWATGSGDFNLSYLIFNCNANSLSLKQFFLFVLVKFHLFYFWCPAFTGLGFFLRDIIQGPPLAIHQSGTVKLALMPTFVMVVETYRLKCWANCTSYILFSCLNSLHDSNAANLSTSKCILLIYILLVIVTKCIFTAQ